MTVILDKNNQKKLDHRIRDKDGKYGRKHQNWSMENFDDGYVDIYGRFKVYLPDHPRADKSGYTFRSIVAYEFYHGVSVTREFAIHHIDGNRLNDSKENLEMMSLGGHTSYHNQDRIEKAKVKRICKTCGNIFFMKKGQLNSSHRKGFFCSQKCYYISMKGMPRVPGSGRKKGKTYYSHCRWCGTKFIVPRYKYLNPRLGLYCSRECKVEYLRANKNRSAARVE